MTRPCGNPHCRCHIANRIGNGWRVGADDDAEHGTYGKYARGCRCSECRGASAAYSRKRRAKARAS